MKKFGMICIAVLAIVCFVGPVLASDIAEPTGDGNDLLFPDQFIQTIPGATLDNVWCRYHNEPVKWHKMTKEGDVWRAPNARRKDVHPYVGDPIGNYQPTTNFCKIENMDGWAEAAFVRWTGGKPWVGFPYIHVE